MQFLTVRESCSAASHRRHPNIFHVQLSTIRNVRDPRNNAVVRCRRSNTLAGKELRQRLRKWLSPPDPSVNYNTACSLHYEGTAKWFTKGPIFADWKESGSLLWVYGKRTSSSLYAFALRKQTSHPIAGSGKSVLRYASTSTPTRFDDAYTIEYQSALRSFGTSNPSPILG